MQDFIDAIRSSVSLGHWQSALFLTLSIPDICGRLEDPTRSSSQRYIKWYERYLSASYAGNKECPFLTPSDCYALRCALLHEGATELSMQRCREILDEVCFIQPDSKGFGLLRPGHRTRLINVTVNDRHFKSTLCLHVDRFCEDMCTAVERWMGDVKADSDVQDRLNTLLKIY